MSDIAYKTRELISYRTRNILIAAGLGLLAVVLTLVYVSHAKNSTPASATAPVAVLVAARDIPIGTTGAALAAHRWLVTKTFQPGDVPAGAVHSTAQLAQLVAVQTTYKGEQLVTQRFGTTQEEGVVQVLHGPNRLYQLPGDANQLLAGTLNAGNRVDVVGSVKVPESGQTHVSTIFLRNLLVVSDPTKPSSTGGDGSVELRVTTAQAQRLFWLEKNADWTLVLRPANGAVDKFSTPASATSLVETASGN